MDFLTSLAMMFAHIRSTDGPIKCYESQLYMVSHVIRT